MHVDDNKTRILVVDDENFQILALSAILKQESFETFAAASGRQALQAASTEPLPEMILLDVSMPDMDGYEVCRRLKENPLTTEIPIIFITGIADEAGEEKGMKLGAVDYITKPYNPAIVLARIKNHLELKRKLTLLDQLATQDGLTGIANRRRFEEYLHFEWLRAMRAGTPISLIMMDIDYFKNFNDNYGHAAGDECLRGVARTLAETLKRRQDLPARYGGEEFACVLPETGPSDAARIAEQLREAVAALRIPHAHSRAASFVSVSVGVGVVLPTQENAPINLIEAADKNLYKAKQLGRNRVCSGTPLEQYSPVEEKIERGAPEVRPQVLIVDDERIQLNFLGTMLKEDYTVSVALNGEQALQRAVMEPHPEIILLDVRMPGIDGYEVCRRLKNNPKTRDIPVIFMSVMLEEEDEAKGLELGAVDYLGKPLKKAIVMARIKLQLELKQAFKQLSDRNALLENKLRMRSV